MVKYKYAEIPEEFNNEIVFLKVVKPLVWVDRKYDEKYDHIPVGSITWILKKHAELNMKDGIEVLSDRFSDDGSIFKYSIHPENNRYGCNYDPSCFELLHTSFQKIRRR